MYGEPKNKAEWGRKWLWPLQKVVYSTYSIVPAWNLGLPPSKSLSRSLCWTSSGDAFRFFPKQEKDQNRIRYIKTKSSSTDSNKHFHRLHEYSQLLWQIENIKRATGKMKLRIQPRSLPFIAIVIFKLFKRLRSRFSLSLSTRTETVSRQELSFVEVEILKKIPIWSIRI